MKNIKTLIQLMLNLLIICISCTIASVTLKQLALGFTSYAIIIWVIAFIKNKIK